MHNLPLFELLKTTAVLGNDWALYLNKTICFFLYIPQESVNGLELSATDREVLRDGLTHDQTD